MSARGDARRFKKQLEEAGLVVGIERRTGVFVVYAKGSGSPLTRFGLVNFDEAARKQALSDLRRRGIHLN